MATQFEFKNITEDLIAWIYQCSFLDTDGVDVTRFDFFDVMFDSVGTSIIETEKQMRNQVRLTRQLDLVMQFKRNINSDSERVDSIDYLWNLEKWITANGTLAPKLSNCGTELWTAENGMLMEVDEENEKATYQMQLHCIYDERY